jgi:hypothetical protein
MVGILVHGDNHYIVRGPRPGKEIAVALTRHWSFIRIAATTPPELAGWTISTREFRQDLTWAAIVAGPGIRNPAVSILLEELDARGVRIDDYTAD